MHFDEWYIRRYCIDVKGIANTAVLPYGQGMTTKRPSPAKSFRFTEEELSLLDEMAAKHGSQKAAIMAGLNALIDAKAISNAELARLVTQRLTTKKGK